MAKILVDVESDGQCPGLFSMVSFGAVHVTKDGVQDTFYGRTAPLLGADYVEEALAVSNTTREQHEQYPDPVQTMVEFEQWLIDIKKKTKSKRLYFMSDNNGFDWQWINYYFHAFVGYNPFGHSSQNLNCLYKGMQRDMFVNMKHLRDTKHTHHPVDDATGNAEALLKMKKMGLKISL